MPAILKNGVRYTGFGAGDTVRSESVICDDGKSLQYKLDETLAPRDMIGDLSDLVTDDTSDIVAAVNEVKETAITSETTGELSKLNTLNKTNLVSAINELEYNSNNYVVGKGIELSVVNGILQVTYETED